MNELVRTSFLLINVSLRVVLVTLMFATHLFVYDKNARRRKTSPPSRHSKLNYIVLEGSLRSIMKQQQQQQQRKPACESGHASPMEGAWILDLSR